ncbi:carbohydrate-binding family 9-like protein [bacterium]|nr:carbohydrate-binding family 9-like protein [bacterium]
MRKLFLFIMIGCLATAAFAASSAKPRMHPTYTIKYAKIKPDFDQAKGDWAAYWNSPAWKQAGTINVDQWTKDSGENRPKTQAKVLYDETGIRILWRVQDDPYIVCKAKKFMDKVSQDSCVEFFFEPSKDKGYINLETNACGVYLWRAQQWPKDLDIKTSYTAVKYKMWGRKEAPPEIGTKVQVRKSLPDSLEAPITKATTWYVESFFPAELLDWSYGIKASDLPGATWRGNFYKIVESNDPAVKPFIHFGAWANIGPITNFHQPAFFGTLKFEKPSAKK